MKLSNKLLVSRRNGHVTLIKLKFCLSPTTGVEATTISDIGRGFNHQLYYYYYYISHYRVVCINYSGIHTLCPSFFWPSSS